MHKLELITSTLQKSPFNKIERQATDWGKIFAIHMSDKGLKSRIHKVQPTTQF